MFSQLCRLEKSLRNFATLTKGETICFRYNDQNYYLTVLEVKPEQESQAISIIETDVEVDFAPPLDYKEPDLKKHKSEPDVPEENPVQVTSAFTGGVYRLDGKPISSPSLTAAPTSTASTISTEAASNATPGSSRLIFGRPSQATSTESVNKSASESSVIPVLE